MAAVELIVGADGVDVADDNFDVDIVMADGSVHHRVFMTPQNASTLLAKWRTTGECGHGAFLAVDDAVLLPNLSEHAIIAAVTAMLEEGEFEERARVCWSPCTHYELGLWLWFHPPKQHDPTLLREILQPSGEHLLLVALSVALALAIALGLGGGDPAAAAVGPVGARSRQRGADDPQPGDLRAVAHGAAAGGDRAHAGGGGPHALCPVALVAELDHGAAAGAAGIAGGRACPRAAAPPGAVASAAAPGPAEPDGGIAGGHGHRRGGGHDRGGDRCRRAGGVHLSRHRHREQHPAAGRCPAGGGDRAGG